MFHFTIRDLLWFMVVSGLAVVCWIERSEAARLRAEREEIQVALNCADLFLAPAHAGGYTLGQSYDGPPLNLEDYIRWLEAGAPRGE